jgi:hypothetical protein
MASIVYFLCAFTALIFAVLLIRAYLRSPAPLLFWTGVCFAVMALQNVLLFVDLVVAPQFDLSTLRSFTAMFAISLLLWGLLKDGSGV